MKQVKTSRMIVTALVVGLLAGTTTLNGQTVLADSYLTSLSVASPTTLNSSLNFPSYLDGPVTGSAALTHAGFFGSILYLANNGAGNTFDGNLIVDSGTLRITGSPFATTTGGFTAPSMTSGDTITINRAGTLYIDDNVSGGYTANRFGTTGDRPDVNLAGGTINLNGLNNVSSSVQTLGALTVSSGVGSINVTRISNGNPALTFASLAISKGALMNVNGTNLGTGSNDARITFTSAPTLTSGILPGVRFWDGNNNTGEFATYGANGIRSFTAADYTVYATDINAATSTENVIISNTSLAAAALTADVTVNSLHYAASGAWNMTKKLTIVSGMLLRGSGVNNNLNISSGTLTAGTGSAIDLHAINGIQTILMSGTSVIADNGVSGVVTLVKSGNRDMSLSSTINNSYSGGTYVLDATLTTGNTANTRYLGSGKVTVNAATLTLGSYGATSNGSGDDYTAINGGKINIASGANGAYIASDTFNIAANSIIAGGSASGQGLASLTRGGNATLAAGAIIGHNALTAALNLTTGTIQDLGTDADLYYGLNADQNNVSGSINIGSGTAFKGISTDRSARNWYLGTINIASGTTSVDFQGHATHGSAVILTLGNGGTANAPDINFAGSGTVDIKAIGSVTLNDSTAAYGDTGAGQNVRFVSTAGSTLTVTAADGMGSGTGIASALVQNGGSLAIGNTTALNGNITVQAGGRLVASQAAGLTGAGALTFNEGSILEISNATGFSGSQATAASIAAGTIVRPNVGSWGAAGTTLDSVLGSGANSVTYQHNGNNAVNPTSAGTAVYTLNKSAGGVGGILINNIANQSVGALANGNITLGANGGIIAATDNTTFTISEDVTGSGSLTIGTTNIIDGAPKRGTVSLSAANSHTGGTIVNAGTLQFGNAAALGANTNSLTVNGGTFNMNNNNVTVGNLTGTGGFISSGTSQTRTLTIGQGDTGGGNFQGVIANGAGATTALTKTGTGTNTLSGANSYTGATAVNGGKLLIDGDQSTANGTVTVGAGATLGGTGIIGGSVTIAATGRLAFHLSTVATSHDKLELAAGKSLTFSGASVLDITESGFLPAAGVYTLVTAPGGIIGATLPTATLPAGYAAIVQTNSTDLQLNVTSVPARGGDLDYFEISTITSPQVAGTEITGITITARDEDDLTANFTGTVTFGGTAGISGTSASFTAGVLSGVSVMPTVAGSGRTFTVTDEDTGKYGTATFNVSPGELDHFAISAIGSPQTAGTAITGITLTAQDANNNTVTGFVGTVTYGGTAGIINETSASFAAGVLSGVSVTPTVAGSGKTFTVTDAGSGKTGARTFNVDPGAVHHFDITGFTATGVVGTPVTDITITAQDANNNTVIGFTGTVTYGGTAGISGPSASFTAGVLTGVSVTPREAGTGVTFTVSDGSGHTDSVESDVVWVNGMVMMAAASVQVNTTTPVASVRANSPYPPVAYAITGGRDAASFNVNATTGELTLTSPAGVVGTKYYVLVQATDSKSGTANVDSILVEVTSTGAAVLSGSVFMFR